MRNVTISLDDETALAAHPGAIRISTSVLRSETAAIGAAALLTALRDGLFRQGR